jgi:hypothetical protein
MTPVKRTDINNLCRNFYELKKKVDDEKAGHPFRESELESGSNIPGKPEKIVINNAGLALIATFLPALFKELQYTENGVFKNRRLQYRALFVLHFMCTGLSASPEYDLQVNKILCGLGIEDPIPFSVELTEREKQEAEQLLNDIIGHWPALKSGSIDALRGSFLLREALLSFNHGRWLLQAERKGYDILLDRIPWSWKTTKFEWMEFYIETEW